MSTNFLFKINYSYFQKLYNKIISELLRNKPDTKIFYINIKYIFNYLIRWNFRTGGEEPENTGNIHRWVIPELPLNVKNLIQ